MGTLRTLQLIGAVAKVIGGLAGAGIGIYEIKEIRANSIPALPDNDPEVQLTIDCEEGFKEVETNN